MSGAAAVGDPEGSARPSRLSRWVPAAGWIRAYDRGRLPRDLLAGAVVAALAVPQALGYAGIAGVPVQMGLYALPLALLVRGGLLPPGGTAAHARRSQTNNTPTTPIPLASPHSAAAAAGAAPPPLPSPSTSTATSHSRCQAGAKGG